MCKSNNGFSEYFSGSGSFQLRQIFDLTNLQRLKIWLFGYNELKPLVIRNCSCTNRCMPCEKRASAQIAHLVFADTQAKAEKTKRAIF